MAQKLDNYLLTHRKRAGLSQDEVAFLLGRTSGTTVTRYERFVRVPGLDTALAFQAIYESPVHQLFAGRYHKVERSVDERLWRLAFKLGKCPPAAVRERKLAWIREHALLAGHGRKKP